MKNSFCLFLICLSLHLFSQKSNLEILNEQLKKEKTDSIILRLNVQLSNDCEEVDIPKYAQTAVDLANRLLQNRGLNSNQKKLILTHLGSAYNDLGYYNRLKGNTDIALDYYYKALSIREQCKDTSGLVLALNNLGSVYYKLGKIKQSLEIYNRCLELQEKSKNKSNSAVTLCSIAVIYDDQGETEKTLSYYYKGLRISTEIQDGRIQARCMLNIGGTYKLMKKLDSAFFYYSACEKLEERLGDKEFIPQALIGIANIYNLRGMSDSAEIVFNKCLKITEAIGDKQNLCSVLVSLANLYLKENNPKKAVDYGSKALILSKELGYPRNIRSSSEVLYKSYRALNNPIKALEMHELFIKMRDSINNIETKSTIIKTELKNEFFRKSIADSLKNANEQNSIRTKIALQNSELRQNAILRWVLIGGIIVVALFVLFFYNRYKLTNTQKILIEQQKELTEKQKKEIEHKSLLITQSIDYAKRIQDAFIQSETVLKENGQDHFILNIPKDIVSGDFLWAKIVNDKFLFAVADCTGHGVPGAFMSLVGYNLLEQAVDVFNKTEPKDILENMSTNLKKALKPKGGLRSYEGMEILLCSLDKKTNKLLFSGSKHRLLHCSSGVITEHRTDNLMADGNSSVIFRQFSIDLKKNDMLYLFTDGYPDQKGGIEKTKFYYGPFKNLILKISSADLSEQKETLSFELGKWKGLEEQVDDILIFGLKV